MPNPPLPIPPAPISSDRVARRRHPENGSVDNSVNNSASGSRPTNAPKWFSCAASELGHVRKVNEDSFLDAREEALWVVADGMGGHSRGDRASQVIIETMSSFKSQENALQSVDDLLDRLNKANDTCRQVAQGKVMGSTVATLYLNKDSAYILWAGDSRIYRHRHGEFSQLTDDHSLVQELCRLGELTPEEAENHPSSNVITRAIGVSDEIDIQVRQVDLQPGDRFLLCSDGLFKDVKPAEVANNLALPSPRQALDELVKLALRRGGTDNVTAIVVQMAIA
ncbi:PP2C family protein-serine/threonine phosphatase [Granulosicoccus antarcticus]|uniref:Serine/threonine phosphatase stp n=1 Tax=Granulosicoccus antarcticus IMCC3135 TaxID=1192854 RepID=A0A2Z2NWN6_9GAMM|nr:protein phosphatase 2C domain-containing protein [Granulosicoccus antarcticus]ASJ75852.1 Serine/threonine phosphatase stp [Granulosicoccus antarcticus IMCC3135]